MGLDRRILSILYFNDIVDVNDVEEFIGEENKYYIVKVKGEIKKLKVPGVSYDDDVFSEFELEQEPPEVEYKDTFVQKTVEEELLEAEKESKNILLSVTKEVVITETVIDKPVSEEIVLEKIKKTTEHIKEIKDKKIIEPKKTTTKRTTKKKTTTTKRNNL